MKSHTYKVKSQSSLFKESWIIKGFHSTIHVILENGFTPPSCNYCYYTIRILLFSMLSIIGSSWDRTWNFWIRVCTTNKNYPSGLTLTHKFTGFRKFWGNLWSVINTGKRKYLYQYYNPEDLKSEVQLTPKMSCVLNVILQIVASVQYYRNILHCSGQGTKKWVISAFHCSVLALLCQMLFDNRNLY
jgi:hypothetical protein